MTVSVKKRSDEWLIKRFAEVHPMSIGKPHDHPMVIMFWEISDEMDRRGI